MLQNNLQYTLAKITLLNINNENRTKKKRGEKSKERKDALKFQAKICVKDSHGSIFLKGCTCYILIK